MAQYRYIRPLTQNYHDFTQKKIKQSQQDAPLKFKKLQSPQPQYIKKPPKKVFNLYPPPPQKKVQVKPTCWESFVGFFSCGNCKCFDRKPSPQKIQLVHQQQVHQQKGERVGKCCIRSFEPQLCTTCSFNLCQQCRNKMFLKMRMCDQCKHRLCLRCSKQLLFQQNIKSVKINPKNKYTLHFQDCGCFKCHTVRDDRIAPQLMKKMTQQGLFAEGIINQNMGDHLQIQAARMQVAQPNSPDPFFLNQFHSQFVGVNSNQHSVVNNFPIPNDQSQQPIPQQPHPQQPINVPPQNNINHDPIMAAVQQSLQNQMHKG